MGKIFDALEKANIKAEKVLPKTTPRDRTQKDIGSEKEKVVALDSALKKTMEHKPDPTLITYHDPQSVEAEHFKVLRTNLLFPASGNPPRQILVTSALPNDGKSFVASNLATSIAQGIEEYVMLIDCDLRKSTVHNYFGYKQVMGLSEHLSQGVDLSRVLLKSPVPKLTILPAGQPPSNPSELLSSGKMKKLLEEVRNRYDDRYIIIDSPPPSMASETMAIVKAVDGVILVVRSGRTPKSAVSEAIEQIGKEKILGVVLNYSDLSLSKYYGYGKKYYKQKD